MNDNEQENERVIEFLKVMNIDYSEAESYLVHRDDSDYSRNMLEGDKKMWLLAVDEFQTAKEFMRPIILSEVGNQ